MVLVESPTDADAASDTTPFLARSACDSYLLDIATEDTDTDHDQVVMPMPRASLASMRSSWRESLALRAERLGLRRDDKQSSSQSLSQSTDANQLEDETDTDDEDGGSRVFPSARIRVWKHVAPPWVNVYLPRFVRLQTGTKPFLEYTRHKTSRVRQRVFLASSTRVSREPRDELLIEFVPMVTGKGKHSNQTDDNTSSSSAKYDQWRLRFDTKKERDVWFKKVQDAIDLLAWIGKYRLGDVIQETETSSIIECFSWNDEDKPSYVMKVVNTNKQLARSVRNELKLHHTLTNFTSHPNILTLHDSFRTSDRACLVVDYCAGGDLFECLRAQGRMEEAPAKTLFRLIVQAIAYIHEHKIVHLDLKPENLLFKSSARLVRSIKVADFGAAQSIAGVGARAVRQVSYTVGYAAPEVLQESEISFAADVFSAGAVLYTILCGHGPFQSADRELTLEKNVRASFIQDDVAWERLSPSAKELLTGMLQADPAQRLTIAQVLDHAWLAAESGSETTTKVPDPAHH